MKTVWEYRNVADENVLKVYEQFHIPKLISVILHNRNIDTSDKISSFFNLKKTDKTLYGFYSPYLMKDIEKSSQRIIKAITDKEKVIIYGDYDVDGITATALLHSFFEVLKFYKKQEVDFECMLPDRIRDGFGLQESGMKRAIDRKASLVITVDNGSSSYDAVKVANENAVDVIITDHHSIPEKLPEAYAIVNTKQKDCKYPFKQHSGVGIVYKLVSVLADKLLSENEKKTFMNRYIDLVALGTYQDSVPLIDENRYFVRKGLSLIKKIFNERLKTNVKGIKHLLDVSFNGARNKTVSYRTIGFEIGPRINCCGRIATPDMAFDILVSRNEKKSKRLASEINELNKKRRYMSEKAYKEAEAEILEKKLDQKKIIVITSENWHKGIISLVANKVLNKFQKPCIAISSFHDKEVLTASCRSTDYLDITEFLTNFKHLLARFGGHKKSAGFSIRNKNLQEFIFGVEKLSDKVITENTVNKLIIDSELEIEDINIDFFRDLSKLEPFGEANSRPIFALTDVKVIRANVSRRGLDTLFTVSKGNNQLNLVLFNNLEYIEEFQTNPTINIALKMREGRTLDEVKVDILDIQFCK